MNYDDARRSESSDRQWQVDQYVLGCGGTDCEAGFDRDAFEQAMLDDPGLALRVAESVGEVGLMSEAARGLASEVGLSNAGGLVATLDAAKPKKLRSSPEHISPARKLGSLERKSVARGVTLGVVAASVMLILGSTIWWVTQGGGAPNGVDDGVVSGLASASMTAELADNWLAFSSQLPVSQLIVSADEMVLLDQEVMEAFDEDWLSAQAWESETAGLEDDWMRFGPEVFVDETDLSDA